MSWAQIGQIMADSARHYLDHNATTVLRPVAKAAMILALDALGNASSVHAEGRRQRGRIEDARRQVAALFGRGPASVTFTSGATEALNMLAQPTDTHCHLFLGATEHAALREGHRFAAGRMTVLPVDDEGIIVLSDLEMAFETLPPSERAKVLVAVQAANNETGVIQPVGAISALARHYGASLIVDAVQAVGRIDTTSFAAWADALVISSHKIGGPAGAGAIVFGAAEARFDALIRGGGQERRRRAGTENVPSIVGFAAALSEAIAQSESEAARLATYRDAFETIVHMLPGVSIAGQSADRLPNTSCVMLEGIESEKALIAFDLQGFALSSGSACSSGKVGPSHVLLAMGLDTEMSRNALRVSFGWSSQDEDCEALCAAFPRIVGTLSKRTHAA